MNENEQHTEPLQTTTEKQQTVIVTRKQIFLAAMVVILVFAGLLVWKTLQVNALNKENMQKEAELKSQFKAAFIQQSSNYL